MGWDSWLFNLAWSIYCLCVGNHSGHYLHTWGWGDMRWKASPTAFVMDDRLASYLDEKYYYGNQLTGFCMTSLLWDPMVKITGATLFLSTVCISVFMSSTHEKFDCNMIHKYWVIRAPWDIWQQSDPQILSYKSPIRSLTAMWSTNF